MAQWQFVSQLRNGAPIADLDGLRNRRFTFQENQPGMASASIYVSDPRAHRGALGGLTPGVHELIAYRDTSPIETVFALTNANVVADTETMVINLEWQGIASYLKDALVYSQTTEYSGTTLPATWISTFQARTGGSYGITAGTVTGTPATRTKTMQSDASLFDTINELASSGAGFSWRISPSRTYEEWHPSRGADNGIVLEYGVNVESFTYAENAGPGEIVSDIRVYGPPGTSTVTASDSTARTTYGRREAAATFFADFADSGVTSTQLQAHADSIIVDRVAPILIPQITLVRSHQSIPWGSYWIGDTVTFRAAVGQYTTINQQYRIVQIDVALDDNDNETITLGVNAA